jgi:arabinose-5-phosphate isomerase
MLALGDALAVVLLGRRGFSSTAFADLHPGGKLGARLVRVRQLMHAAPDLPLVEEQTPMAEALLVMSRRRLGCGRAVPGRSAVGQLGGRSTPGWFGVVAARAAAGRSAGGCPPQQDR